MHSRIRVELKTFGGNGDVCFNTTYNLFNLAHLLKVL